MPELPQQPAPSEGSAHPPRKRPPTQKDVAREAGVSQAMVSFYLNSAGRAPPISDRARAAIEKAIETLKYRPNASARAMRCRRSHSIGYVLSGTRGRFDGDHFDYRAGVYETASRLGYKVVVIRLDTPSILAPEAVQTLPRILREAHLDGLILNRTVCYPSSVQNALQSCDLPTVHLNEKTACDAVFVDDLRGTEFLAEHLCDRGYSRIRYLKMWTRRRPHYSEEDRRSSLRQFLEARGLPYHELVPERPTQPRVTNHLSDQEVVDWLSDPGLPPADAIIAYNDRHAAEFMRLLYQRSIRVPDTLAVAGFNNEEVIPSVPLTTMDIRRFDLASTAVQMLVERIERGGPPTPSISLLPNLIERASTAPKAPQGPPRQSRRSASPTRP